MTYSKRKTGLGALALSAAAALNFAISGTALAGETADRLAERETREQSLRRYRAAATPTAQTAPAAAPVQEQPARPTTREHCVKGSSYNVGLLPLIFGGAKQGGEVCETDTHPEYGLAPTIIVVDPGQGPRFNPDARPGYQWGY